MLGLDRKAFATTTSARSVRVVKSKTFAIQATGKFQRGVEQVEETFQVGDNFHVIIFKNLVIRLRFIVEVDLVRQSGATAGNDAYPEEIVVSDIARLPNISNFLLGAV